MRENENFGKIDLLTLWRMSINCFQDISVHTQTN